MARQHLSRLRLRHPLRFYHSFESGLELDRAYGNQGGILDYIKHCVAKYDLAPRFASAPT
jgi:hypothetical protein